MKRCRRGNGQLRARPKEKFIKYNEAASAHQWQMDMVRRLGPISVCSFELAKLAEPWVGLRVGLLRSNLSQTPKRGSARILRTPGRTEGAACEGPSVACEARLCSVNSNAAPGPPIAVAPAAFTTIAITAHCPERPAAGKIGRDNQNGASCSSASCAASVTASLPAQATGTHPANELDGACLCFGTDKGERAASVASKPILLAVGARTAGQGWPFVVAASLALGPSGMKAAVAVPPPEAA